MTATTTQSAPRSPDRGSRTAVVTGAGSPRGIGRATALRLGRDGWAVAVLDLDGDAAASVAREVADRSGVPTTSARCDVTDEASVDAAAALVEDRLPEVGALVNIAGITSPTRFFDTTLAEWQHLLTVNATGTYITTKRFTAGMAERGAGRVVTMSSVSAVRGGGVFGGVPYSAAKAAILGFTRALARELGPSGVTVNAIAPGVVDTDIRAGGTSPEMEARLADDVPLGRQGTVEDIAGLVSYLVGPDASYVTGATYDINGGSHIS